MPSEEHKQLITRWFIEIFAEGRMETVDEIVAADFVAHAPGADPDAHGRETFKRWLGWYRSAFTDQDWQILDVFSEGEKCAVRYSGRTTYRGGLLDIPSKNQRIIETGILIFLIRDGQVQELWSEMSDLQVFQQLGAAPLGTATGGSPAASAH